MTTLTIIKLAHNLNALYELINAYLTLQSSPRCAEGNEENLDLEELTEFLEGGGDGKTKGGSDESEEELENEEIINNRADDAIDLSEDEEDAKIRAEYGLDDYDEEGKIALYFNLFSFYLIFFHLSV